MAISVFLCSDPWGDSPRRSFCYHPFESVDTSLTHHQSQAIKGCLFWGTATKAVTLNMYINSFLKDTDDWEESMEE